LPGGHKLGWQYFSFPEPVAGNECYFVLGNMTEGHLPLPAKQIQSTEILATRKGIQRLIYLWERVGLLDGNTVESAAILLLDQGQFNQILVKKIL